MAEINKNELKTIRDVLKCKDLFDEVELLKKIQDIFFNYSTEIVNLKVSCFKSAGNNGRSVEKITKSINNFLNDVTLENLKEIESFLGKVNNEKENNKIKIGYGRKFLLGFCDWSDYPKEYELLKRVHERLIDGLGLIKSDCGYEHRQDEDCLCDFEDFLDISCLYHVSLDAVNYLVEKRDVFSVTNLASVIFFYNKLQSLINSDYDYDDVKIIETVKKIEAEKMKAIKKIINSDSHLINGTNLVNPLFEAGANEDYQTVEYFIKKGADMEIYKKYFNTISSELQSLVSEKMLSYINKMILEISLKDVSNIKNYQKRL